MSDQKKFLAECALYIKGDLEVVKLHGNREVVHAISSALIESKKLHDELHESSDMSKIVKQVQKKRRAAKKLQNITGFIWPF